MEQRVVSVRTLLHDVEAGVPRSRRPTGRRTEQLLARAQPQPEVVATTLLPTTTRTRTRTSTRTCTRTRASAAQLAAAFASTA